MNDTRYRDKNMHQNIYADPDYNLLEACSVLISHNKNWLKVENFEKNTDKTHGFNGEIEGVMISSDQASILVYTSDGELATICSKTLNKSHSIKTKNTITCAFHLNLIGNILCVYEEAGVEVFSSDLSKVLFKTQHNTDHLYPEILLSGQYLLCQEDTSTLEIWNIKSSTSFFRMNFDDAEISHFEITQNMKFLSVTFEGGEYKIYKIPSGQCILTKPSSAEVILFPKS